VKVFQSVLITRLVMSLTRVLTFEHLFIGEDTKPVPRNHIKFSKQGKDSPWNSIDKALQNGIQASQSSSLHVEKDFHIYDTICDMESETEFSDMNGNMTEVNSILSSSDLERRSRVNSIYSSSEYTEQYSEIQPINAMITASLRTGKTTYDRESETEFSDMNGNMTEVNSILSSLEMNGEEDMYSVHGALENKTELYNDEETDCLYCSDDVNEENIVHGPVKTVDLSEREEYDAPPFPARPRLPPPLLQANIKLNKDENMTYRNSSTPCRELDDYEVMKLAHQQPQPQNALSTQCHSMHNACGISCSHLHQEHQCSNSCEQNCVFPPHSNKCCLLDLRCQQLCPGISVMQFLHHCPSASHISNLKATVSDLVSEQFKKCMANMSKGVACNDGENSRKHSVPDSQCDNTLWDIYQPLIQRSVCSTNERILENVNNRREDADCHPATRLDNRSSRKSKKRCRREKTSLLSLGRFSSLQKRYVSFVNSCFLCNAVYLVRS